MQKERVIKWNRDRGLLGTFDPNLERKMLSEEAREFYLAETLEHKLAEYADFLFVLEGTKAKYICNSGINNEFFNAYEVYKGIERWASDLIQEMDSVLQSMYVMLGSNKRHNDVALACRVVCDCNELKGVEKISGKIVKGVNYVNPVTVISKLIGV